VFFPPRLGNRCMKILLRRSRPAKSSPLRRSFAYFPFDRATERMRGEGGGSRSLNLYGKGTISRARVLIRRSCVRSAAFNPDDFCESLLPPSPSRRGSSPFTRTRTTSILAKRILAAERVTTKSSEGKTFRERDIVFRVQLHIRRGFSLSLSLFSSLLHLSPFLAQRDFIIPHYGELFSDIRGLSACRRENLSPEDRSKVVRRTFPRRIAALSRATMKVKTYVSLLLLFRNENVRYWTRRGGRRE